MAWQRASIIFRSADNLRKFSGGAVKFQYRTKTPLGTILPEPKRPRFGFLGVFCSVTTGLIIGATLSKMMANFLEEKELFVPSDDDDDDD